ncbi:MAG: rhodanese-like domain-containing protein [Actinomycetota bacterium]
MSDLPVKKAWDMVEEAKGQIDNLSAEELAAEMAAEDGPTVVDIRDHRELYLKGKIPGAVHAPRGMLEFWVDPASEYYREVFEPSKRYVLYCAGGGRSALAAKTMKDMGYGDIGHLEPGFGGWEAAGQEIEDIKASSKWVPRES